MKGRSLLAFTALAVALACDSDRHPTGISEAGVGTSSVLSDGANGGNPDFFFLPPLVKKPKHDPNFELGKFNNALQPSLIVEICALESTGADLPIPATECDGAPLKTFGAGTVQLVNLPGSKPGVPKGFNPESWWKGHDRADGFYYVLWDTRQPGLSPDKYYRIKVLVEGSDIPLGYADVDLKSKGRKWQHSRTRDMIEMVDGVMLPIPFRVEKGALCDDASACNSATITNNTDPNAPDQIVQVEGPNGPIGGAAFPPNFLPAGGPQSIVVTISRVNTKGSEGAPGTVCHPGLRMQQFEGCFRFETIPELNPIDEGTDDQFTADVRVAVCFELDGTNDPRKEFVQLWASDAGKAPRRLPPASDAGILTNNPAARNCGDGSQGALNRSTGVMALADAAWRKIQGGLGRAFSVKTAYAVDKGLGGLVKGFSNISPVLTTEIIRAENTELPVEPGATVTATVRIVGSGHHEEEGGPLTGFGGQPVTFSVAADHSHGVLRPFGTEGDSTATISMLSSSSSENPEAPVGFAEVSWTLPREAGTYTLLATGADSADTVSFTARVSTPDVGFLFLGTLSGDDNSLAYDINNAGQIVGASYNGAVRRPFIWEDGAMTSLGSLGGTFGEAYAINSAGVVVGYSATEAGVSRAFRWQNNVMTMLPTLPGTGESYARGINSAGHIVGYSVNAQGHHRGWILRGETLTELLPLPGGTQIQPFAINDTDEVTGWGSSEAGFRAWIWDRGERTVLGTLAGRATIGVDINNAATVVGGSEVSANLPNAFVWSGTITNLTPELVDTDGMYSWAAKVAEDGRIVGYRHDGTESTPVLWQGGSMIDLATFDGSRGEATGINDVGRIVGYTSNSMGKLRATRWVAPALEGIP